MKIAGRQYRAQYNADSIRACNVAHGSDIVANFLQSFLAGVLGNVIGPGEHYNYFRFQENDVLSKSDQHLRRGLAGDAAVDIWLSGKKLAAIRSPRRSLHAPTFGDGISHKHDARFAGGRRR